MHPAHHAHIETIFGQYLGELRFTDCADRGHEVDLVFLDYIIQAVTRGNAPFTLTSIKSSVSNPPPPPQQKVDS